MSTNESLASRTTNIGCLGHFPHGAFDLEYLYISFSLLRHKGLKKISIWETMNDPDWQRSVQAHLSLAGQVLNIKSSVFVRSNLLCRSGANNVVLCQVCQQKC